MITGFSDVVPNGRVLLIFGLFVKMVWSVTTHHVSPFLCSSRFGRALGLVEDSTYGLWVVEQGSSLLALPPLPAFPAHRCPALAGSPGCFCSCQQNCLQV